MVIFRSYFFVCHSIHEVSCAKASHSETRVEIIKGRIDWMNAFRLSEFCILLT